MKKILLSIFVMVITFNTFSQTRIETYKNCFGYYNNYYKKFDLGDYHFANISFYFYETYVSVDDDAHSIYRIIRISPKEYFTDYQITTFQCLDERNRDCKVALIKYSDGSSSVDVIYDDRAFIYVIK